MIGHVLTAIITLLMIAGIGMVLGFGIAAGRDMWEVASRRWVVARARRRVGASPIVRNEDGVIQMPAVPGTLAFWTCDEHVHVRINDINGARIAEETFDR